MEMISTQPEAIAFLKAVFVSWATPTAILLGLLVHAYEVKSARDKWLQGFSSVITLLRIGSKQLKAKLLSRLNRASLQSPAHPTRSRWALLIEHLSHG